MPLYEYQCNSCLTVSEYLVGVGNDQPDLVCGSCGSDRLRRLISIMSVSRGTAPETCCGGGECRPAACERGSCGCGG